MDQKGKAATFWQEEWLGHNINNLEKNDEDLNQKYGSEMRKKERIFNGENKVDSHISGSSDWAASITQVGNAIQKKKSDFNSIFLILDMTSLECV